MFDNKNLDPNINPMTDEPIKNVIAYVRVSTDAQAEEDRYGLDAQKEQITEYCNTHNFNIVKWVADEGESGAKFRPGFDQIVFGDVTNPPFEAVVVAKSDRVARDVEIYFAYQGLLRRKKIELSSICEDFGQFGAFAGVLKAFTLTCAQMERDNINKRTSAGRQVKSSRGGYSGGRPPYGYKAENHQLVIVPEEAEAVRDIFRMKADGYTFMEICNYLNDKGLKNHKGSDFAISTVQVILNNKKLYQGYYKYGKNAEWVKGWHDAILTEE